MTAELPISRAALLAAALVAAQLAGGSGFALAQEDVDATIWDIELGTPVAALPIKQFVDPACGTNGGLRGLPLASFEEFALCPQQNATGYREIWFVYDDLFELTARARRLSETMIGLQRSTQVLNQPVNLSLLVDDDGLVQGYRISSDQRADPALRETAHAVAIHYKGRFGVEDWSCVDLPPADGETPFGNRFVKQDCEKDVDGTHMSVETRLFYRAGQSYQDPHSHQLMTNAFESSARFELYRTEPAPIARSVVAAAAAPSPSDPEGRLIAGLTRDCPGCDLADADLRRLDLTGANLAGANLKGAILHRAVLTGADLSGADLELANLNKANLTNAVLRDANLTKALLYQTEAYGADFSGANLSQASLPEVRLIAATLDNAVMNGADFFRARMNDASFVDAEMNATDMTEVTLMRADMRGVAAESADIVQARLRGADLSNAVLRRSDLYGTDLSATNLSGADLSLSRLVQAKLQDSDQTDTIFSGALMPDNNRHP